MSMIYAVNIFLTLSFSCWFLFVAFFFFFQLGLKNFFYVVRFSNRVRRAEWTWEMPGNDSGKELVNGRVTRESSSVNPWVGDPEAEWAERSRSWRGSRMMSSPSYQRRRLWVMTRLRHDHGRASWQDMGGQDAQVEVWRELGGWKNSPMDIEVRGVWVDRSKGIVTRRIGSNIKVLSKCSIARKSWQEARGQSFTSFHCFIPSMV